MYSLGTGQALSRVSNGRFTPHHCIIYSINAFFGPDIGSFSLWLTSTLGFGASYASTIENLIHHPFYYFLILGYPLSLFYSWASRFFLHKGFLDSISGVCFLILFYCLLFIFSLINEILIWLQVPLTKRQCFLLIAAGSLSHFFLDHLFEVWLHSFSLLLILFVQPCYLHLFVLFCTY